MARKKRTKKDMPFSRKIKPLDKYGPDAGVYDLSVPIKVDGAEVNFLVIVRPTPVSGRPITSMFQSDSDGNITSKSPLYKFKGKNVKDWLLELGYNLI